MEQGTALTPGDILLRIKAAKETLGGRVMVLGHHYQRDEIYRFADHTGDSFGLAKAAGANPDVSYIVFCGVHFMAESADILTRDDQTVILPDLEAGCTMADMAVIEDVEEAWEILTETQPGRKILPITYVNSSAEVKALVSFYMENAAIIRRELTAAGLTIYGGEHAPYVWIKTPEGMDSWGFFDHLLNKANVVGTPGSGFGAAGEGYFRLSAFNSRSNVDEAMRRIRAL